LVLDLRDQVVFTGARTDIDVLLHTLDLFVLPSLFEGLPLSLLEAMAAGVPVLATDVPGSREVIEDGLNGRLVAAADVEALAAAMIELLADPSVAGQMAARGRETVRQSYNIEAVARRYDRIYQEAQRFRELPPDEMLI
jgi:glycosyltransferase involved in cell wall biosynthesis